jgi:hypothetical protein
MSTLRQIKNLSKTTASIECIDCKKSITNREFIRCAICKNIYDLNCANVASKRFELMLFKAMWCPPRVICPHLWMFSQQAVIL